MSNIIISDHGIEKLLTDLDPNKATGPDGVPGRILKLGAKEIAPALEISQEISRDKQFARGLEECKCGLNLQKRRPHQIPEL